MTSPRTSTERKARKRHCCGSCEESIAPGEFYLRHTTFPGDDNGFADSAGHPVSLAECADCAERYGRPLRRDA